MDPDQEISLWKLSSIRNRTRNDTQDQGKLILIVNNVNYPHVISKLQQLIENLHKNKHALATMKSSLEQYQTYPEINGGIPANNNTRAKAAALKLDLESQSVPAVVSIRSSNPNTLFRKSLQTSTQPHQYRPRQHP